MTWSSDRLPGEEGHGTTVEPGEVPGASHSEAPVSDDERPAPALLRGCLLRPDSEALTTLRGNVGPAGRIGPAPVDSGALSLALVPMAGAGLKAAAYRRSNMTSRLGNTGKGHLSGDQAGRRPASAMVGRDGLRRPKGRSGTPLRSVLRSACGRPLARLASLFGTDFVQHRAENGGQ